MYYLDKKEKKSIN